MFLKKEIQKKLGIDPKYQELRLNGRILEDSETFANIGIDGEEPIKEIELSITHLSASEFIKLKNS